MPSVASADYFVPGLHEAMPETRVIASLDGDAGFFETVLDIVNPLQHIPGVSTLYRAITGDAIAGPARLIGGALFGGPLGFASALTNLVVEEASGRDLGDHALALLAGSDAPAEVAAAAPAGQAAAQVAATQVAATQVAATQVAAAGGAAPGAATIVWNGPRVVPSLTRTAAADAPAEAPQAAAAAQIAADSTPPPAWISAAIADAQTVNEAAALGQPAAKPTAQPWVADAMLEALAKYEALARERNR